MTLDDFAPMVKEFFQNHILFFKKNKVLFKFK